MIQSAAVIPFASGGPACQASSLRPVSLLYASMYWSRVRPAPSGGSDGAGGRRFPDRRQHHQQNGPVRCGHTISLRRTGLSGIQVASGKPLVSLDVFVAGSASHFGGEGRSRRLFVPADFLQIVTNVLLIK